MRASHSAFLAVTAALEVAGLTGLATGGCGSTTSTQAWIVADSAPAPATKAAATDSSPSDDAADGTADVSVVDAGKDATDARDAVTDAQADVADARDDVTDANPYMGDGSVGSIALQFAKDQAMAMCAAELACCPAGNYDLARCAASAELWGWEGSLPPSEQVYARGHITLDPARAMGCIEAIKGFPCGTQTAAEWDAITQACELVIQGTIRADSPTRCIASWECAPGNFCSTSGVCTPLRTAGQPCDDQYTDDYGSPWPDQVCSYLSSSGPGLYCDLIHHEADAATCQPRLTEGAVCVNFSAGPLDGWYDDNACPTGGALCGDDWRCGGTTSYPYPNLCAFWAATDGGSTQAPIAGRPPWHRRATR